MGVEILAERTYDVKLIIKTLSCLWDNISEDGSDINIPDVLNEYYIAVYDGENYCGVARVYPIGRLLFEGHIFLIKRENSEECGRALLRWCKDNINEMEKLSCRIPDCFDNVKDFVKKIGFKSYSHIDNCYLHKKQVIGVEGFLISKEEII